MTVADKCSEGGSTYRVIRLENPRRANCLGIETMARLQRAVQETPAGPLVLAAEGSSFCSGLDLDEILHRGTPAEHLRGLRDLVYALERTDASTVSVVEGTTVAGGIALACCTDVAFARAGVRFKTPDAPAYGPMVTFLKALVKAYRPNSGFDALAAGQPAGQLPSFVDATIPAEETDAIQWALRKVEGAAPAKRRAPETKRRSIDDALQAVLATDTMEALLSELRGARGR